MTRVTVNTGICGFTAEIKVEKLAKRQFSVTIDSRCPLLKELSEIFTQLSLADVLKPAAFSPLYSCAAEAKVHASCPVPAAVIKAAECELELALPKDVTIKFAR